jgi:hypothetical protein
MLVDVSDRELDVALHDRQDTQLALDRKEHPDLVEQRSRRAREVIPVGRETLHRGLAGPQHSLSVLTKLDLVSAYDFTC